MTLCSDNSDNLTALARSLIYDVLAGAFSYHFDVQSFAQRLTEKEQDASLALSELAQVGYRLDFGEIFSIARSHSNLQALTDIQSEYVALFDRPSTKYALSAFESVHLKGYADLTVINQIVQFYERYGLNLSPQASETADHCSVEWAFMSYLAFEQAKALEHEQDCQRWEQGQREFLTQHIMKWMTKWLPAVAGAAQHPFFTVVANFAQEFLTQDAQLMGVVLDAA